jgi:hypothetical protein
MMSKNRSQTRVDEHASAAGFAAAAAAVDAERERVLAALAAARQEAPPEQSTNAFVHALILLNARCEELRAAYFPHAATLSIAYGTATTWSYSGLMRTVWRKAAG